MVCATEYCRVLVHRMKEKIAPSKLRSYSFVWCSVIQEYSSFIFLKNTRKVEFMFRSLTPRLILFPPCLPALSYKLLRERDVCTLHFKMLTRKGHMPWRGFL